jgi:hypothetical protein
MQILIDIAKERKRGRENDDTNSRRNTEEQDQDAFAPVREGF